MECVLSQAHKTLKKSGDLKRYLQKAVAQPRSHIPLYSSGSSSGAAAAVLQALAFLCQRSRCTRVWLVHSSRKSNHNIFVPNATVKHTSSDLIPGTRRIQRQQTLYVAHTYHWDEDCVPHFRLAATPTHKQTHPEEELYAQVAYWYFNSTTYFQIRQPRV